jgi:vacuolar-type H+-ATPase subunit I/STV1
MEKIKLKPEVRLKKVESEINNVLNLLYTKENSDLISELKRCLKVKKDIINEISSNLHKENYTHFIKPNILKKSEKKENLKNHITELNIKISKKNKEAFIAREKMLYWQKIVSKLLSKKELEACHKEINDLEELLNK